jgi:hypothetical protein
VVGVVAPVGEVADLVAVGLDAAVAAVDAPWPPEPEADWREELEPAAVARSVSVDDGAWVAGAWVAGA